MIAHPPPPMPGRMQRVCMYCRANLGDVPCIAELDGETSHGICPCCAPAAMAEALAVGAMRGMSLSDSMKAPPNWERYVAALEVAAVCQVSEYTLDTRFRPDSWASPRDFCTTGSGVLMFAIESLPQLADALQAAGQIDAALALREWATRRIADVRAKAAAPVIAARTAGASHGWAQQWERDHEL